jgi:hypothetical protein
MTIDNPNDNDSPFRDSTGRWRTQSLFKEFPNPKYPFYWTLRREDTEDGIPSLYKLYMQAKDPSEYHFALKYLGGWEHWQTLCNARWFRKYVDLWREELKVLVQSDHYAIARALAEDSSAKVSERMTAIKWLSVNSGYDKKDLKRGRPSKEEVEGRLRQDLKALEEHNEDLERLGLN